MDKKSSGGSIRADSNPSEKIIEGIAKQNGLDPIELPSLYEYIDPELLDQLVEGQGTCRITFEYLGYEVTVFDDECILIQKIDSDHSIDSYSNS